MCITLISTSHHLYPFILLSNRDEFVSRPTARSNWWDEPYAHVLGGRDLQREEKGTWLGITTDGRIAVLTNYRDEGVEVTKGKSRGGIVTLWLKPSPQDAPKPELFADEMIYKRGIHDVGGFSLLFGSLREDRGEGLAIISNRTASSDGLIRVANSEGETHGLSNSFYGDLTWPKVVHGELLLRQAVKANIDRGDSKEKFIASLFDVLSIDTLPRRKDGEDWASYVRQLRNSIFIPPIGGRAVESTPADTLASGHRVEVSSSVERVQDGEEVYGTQKQTIILVDTEGKVTWVEKTLFDEHAQAIPDHEKDTKFEFQIQGWKSR